MDISFNNIPASLKTPGFYFEFARSGLSGPPLQNSLLIGQTVTAQSAVPVFVSSVAQAIALWGAHSMLAEMVEAHLAADPNASLYALPLADAVSGVQAAGSIAFTGTTTAAGTLALYIGGHFVPVAIASGVAATAVATAVIAAINAWIDYNGIGLPVSAAVDGTHAYQVNLTAVHKGTLGNAIDVRLNYYGAQAGEATPAGLTVAIIALTAGATDPDLAALDATLADVNFDFITCPLATSTELDSIKTLLTNRWAWNRMIFGGVFSARKAADATGTADISFGTGRNDQHVSVMCYEPSPSSPWVVAAVNAATFGASSRADPARPVQTLPLPGILPPPVGSRYTKATRETLLNSGLALMDYATDGTCTILRQVTTYQKNSAGAPDTSYLDAETLFTLAAVVRQQSADLSNAFPRAKLADNGTNFGAGMTFSAGAPDQPITTPNGIRAEIIASYSRMMEDKAWVQDLDGFIAGLTVQRNSTDASRVDVMETLYIVSGVRILAVKVGFSLF